MIFLNLSQHEFGASSLFSEVSEKSLVLIESLLESLESIISSSKFSTD